MGKWLICCCFWDYCCPKKVGEYTEGLKKLSRFLAVLAVLTVALVAVPAYAAHSWGNYHWARTANPFTLMLADAVTPAWDPYLVEARNDWNASTVLDTVIVSSSANPKTCRAVAGRMEVCSAKYGNNGWLGLASIWADSNGHITKGTAKMNDTYFNNATYNTPAWRRLVMCQEVAHVFGLAHQDEGFTAPNLGSCMDYTNDPDGGGVYGPSNEHPNAHDFAQLEALYGHTDSYTTLSAVVAQVTGLTRRMVYVDEDDEGLGQEVGQDSRGRPNRYVRSYANGTTKITHVFWLPGLEEEHEHEHEH